jgi:hypothetical protein
MRGARRQSALQEGTQQERAIMDKYVLKQHPDLRQIVEAACPRYRKHHAYVVVADRVTLSGTFWDDGSRSTYVAVDLLSRRVKSAPQYDPPQFGGPRETPVVTLPENVVIVEVGVFRGKQATATVYVRAANLANLLPQSRSQSGDNPGSARHAVTE